MYLTDVEKTSALEDEDSNLEGLKLRGHYDAQELEESESLQADDCSELIASEHLKSPMHLPTSSDSKTAYVVPEHSLGAQQNASLVTHVRELQLFFEKWSSSLESIIDLTKSEFQPNRMDRAELGMGLGPIVSSRRQMRASGTPRSRSALVSEVSECREHRSRSSSSCETAEVDVFVGGLEHVKSIQCDKERVFRTFSKVLMDGALGTPAVSPKRLLHRQLQSQVFEFACAFVIFLNAIFMLYLTEYSARHLEVPKSIFVTFSELFFTTFYTCELIMRVAVYGVSFFRSADWRWNYFDVVLVIFALYDQVVQAVAFDKLTMNPTFLRVVRLMKMAKLLRMIRLLRIFRELRLLLTSIIGSMKSMLWAMIVIVLVTYMFGMCFLQAATGYLIDEANAVDPDLKADITKHWGSVESSMLSLYACGTSGDSWRIVAEPLRSVGMMYYYLFLVYIAFFMFVIVNTLTSLFIENTIQNADKDRQVMVQVAMAQRTAYMANIADLFRCIDADGSGELTFAEMLEKTQDPKMVGFAASLDIEVTDVAQFFAILSENGRYPVDIETFVSGCMKLRGTARSHDVLGLVHYVRRTQAQQLELLQDIDNSLEAQRDLLSRFA
eukprot:TRINITY_DN904_c0_g2_i3.p1 TRINITY_DN904_c0_g2~~TRINITY_DN904_c0_g2_i3.p1  ORF type:complete len:611 (-),score=82.62 TRINITY_DN904_c0_g2_i3:74-1906(-)